MKITPSQSLLLATLAISSSQGSLAAPAADSASSGGLSPSNSARSLAARRPSVSERAIYAGARVDDGGHHQQPDTNVDIEVRADDVEDRGLPNVAAMVKSVPILGSVVTPVCKALGVNTAEVQEAESVETLSPEQIERIKQAVKVASDAIKGAFGQDILARDSSSTVTPSGTGSAPSESSTSTSTATASGTLSAAAAGPTPPANPLSPAMGAVPVTPALPAQPPNTPAIPGGPSAPAVPGAPVPAPAAPGAPAAPPAPGLPVRDADDEPSLMKRVTVPVPAALGKIPVPNKSTSSAQPSQTAAAADVDGSVPDTTSTSAPSAPSSASSSASEPIETQSM